MIVLMWWCPNQDSNQDSNSLIPLQVENQIHAHGFESHRRMIRFPNVRLDGSLLRQVLVPIELGFQVWFHWNIQMGGSNLRVNLRVLQPRTSGVGGVGL